MALFGLLKDKCAYCTTSIENGHAVVGAVKVPGYVGTKEKKFCSKEHMQSYVDEVKALPKSGGSCCG